MASLEIQRAEHQRDISRAVMAEALRRAKNPNAVAAKMRGIKMKRREQTPQEWDRAVDILTAKYGWKERPATAFVHPS